MGEDYGKFRGQLAPHKKLASALFHGDPENATDKLGAS